MKSISNIPGSVWYAFYLRLFIFACVSSARQLPVIIFHLNSWLSF